MMGRDSMRHARGLCIPLPWRAAAAERYAVAMAPHPLHPGRSARAGELRRRPRARGERLVDLTHPFDQDTIYWPGNQGFELEHTKWGEDEQGRWYAAAQFRAAEHGGTHLDAPLHFAPKGRAVADIPLAQLIGPARVIDVQPQCVANRDYQVSVDDITAHEAAHGRLSEGSVVLIPPAGRARGRTASATSATTTRGGGRAALPWLVARSRAPS
jgi:kynurenine formamidase